MTPEHKQNTGKPTFFSVIWHLDDFEAQFNCGQAKRAEMSLHFN